MARSRLELRREAEAAEAREKVAGDGGTKAKKPRKAPAKRTSRAKAKAVQRKRMVWVIYSGTMKEEGRFAYDQKEAAEEKLETLRSKSKKLYFLQPVKEVIGEGAAVPAEAVEAEDEKPKRSRAKAAAAEEEAEDEEEPEIEEDEDEE